jgi:fructose 5-dehydrogenase cytochrome subunit
MRPLAMTAVVVVCSTFAAVAVAQSSSPIEIERGRYLATAGDCAACHTDTAGGGKPFAGGHAIATPLGAIYTPNITPSKVYGIGAYSEAQFARALRGGVRADGPLLYPAMPYTAYAKLSDADVHALYAYFMQVAPVDAPTPVTRLPFPFNLRWSMTVWNALFLRQARFQPDPRRSAEWNRGAYLAEALEHCSACHTPRNLLMAEDSRRAYAGSANGSWYAPNITSDPVSGIGGWSRPEIVQYLKTGAVHRKAQAAAGMAEVVTNSLQFLTDADLNALAAYMQAIPPIRERGATRPDYAWGGPARSETTLRGAAVDRANQGAAYYSRYCASCHQPSGAGTPDEAIPPLFNNAATGSRRPDNLISAMLSGVEREAGGRKVLMPNFGPASFVQPLDDSQVAEIANYARTAFGDPAAPVTAHDVAVARKGGAPPLLARAAALLPATLAVGVLALVAALWSISRRLRTPAP